MSAAPDRWSDLATRMGSGLIMVLIGVAGIWYGGDVFHALVAVVCGLMVWELARMLCPDGNETALRLGGLSGMVVLIASYLPLSVAIPMLIAVSATGVVLLTQHKRIYCGFTLLVLAAGFGMMHVRDDLGFAWMVWLVLVVVVTDVAGYFAGRLIGGPKFWPKISPKKTWSGTIAGWVGAAVVGAIFAAGSGVMAAMVFASVVLSFASQLGDIGESAIKRYVGVKDSSSLIPGHGGVLDRFDGMLGASVALLMLEALAGFPWGTT